MTPPRQTRAQRLAMLLARDVVRDLAVEHGGCVRPVQLRRTDLDTGAGRAGARPLRPHPRRRLPVLRRAGTRRCGQRNAAKAGTWTPSPPSPRMTRTTSSACGSSSAQEPSSGATTPTPPDATRPSWTSWRATWTSRSPDQACVATSCPPDQHAATAQPVAARTPRTCHAVRSSRGRSARPTPPRTARRSGRPCSSR